MSTPPIPLRAKATGLTSVIRTMKEGDFHFVPYSAGKDPKKRYSAVANVVGEVKRRYGGGFVTRSNFQWEDATGVGVWCVETPAPEASEFT